MITVEKKKVTRSGVASLGWHLRHGYVQEVLSVKSDKWCVLEDGKILAECRSKAAAQKISDAFEWIGHGA